MPPALFLSGPCKVCEQPARGRHFGVMSCRACAAFFRRAGSGNSKYLGRLCEKKDCKIFHNGKYQCKVCRLKKCHDVGMDPMKFQTDRDLISSTFLARANSSSPQSLSNFLGRPEFILSCEPDKASHIKTLIDVSFLIDKARMFFEYNTSGYDIPLKFDNSLEKLTFAMEDMKLKRANLDIATVKYIGKAENMIFWECAFIGAAQWFSELPEFAELHIDVKIEILKTAWLLWARLDKLAQTADFHRRNILEGNKYLWTEDTCTDLKDVEVDLKWCTNYTKEQLAALMVPDINIHWKRCLDIFMELEPTNTEINFLIIELCLGEVLKKFDGEVVEAAERLLKIQSDNLHHYYVNKMKMPHYSGRLAKLIRVNREIQAESFSIMPAPLYLTGPCEICDQPGHGRHFGVMSCRACAAFFRRMATKNVKLSQKNRKRCLLENEKSTNTNIEIQCFIGNCEIYKNGKFNCKKCRLKKCYDMGMDAQKFQTNRDPLSSTYTFFKRLLFTAPQSMSTFLGRPEFILCCEPDKASHIKTIIDVSHLLEKAKRIFKEEDSFSTVMPYNFENSLEKQSYSMELMRSKNPKIPLEKLRVIGKTEALFFWEQEFLGAAYWFAGIPEFMELDLSIKIEIVKAAWILWIRLEKLAETAYYHKKKALDGDLIICGQHTCMDMKDFEIDIKWCTNYTMEQMRFYIMPETDKDWKECVRDLVNLNPTNVELNFMLLQLSLHAAGKRHQGKVLEATERLLQIQADHLHKYYIETLKMPHYAKRLTELLKVNKSIELDGRRRKERVQIAQVFDVFSIDFSHPEMFEFT